MCGGEDKSVVGGDGTLPHPAPIEIEAMGAAVVAGGKDASDDAEE